MRIEIAPGVAWQMVGEEAVLVDLDSGNAMGLNETGSWIWSMLEGHDLGEIVASFADKFAIESSAASRDVDAFVSDLIDRGLLIRKA